MTGQPPMTPVPVPVPVAVASSRVVGRPRDEAVDAAVLDAVTELLAERGYQPVTMEAVAARAGVAKSTVYRRWPGKDELVLEALARLKGTLDPPPGESVRADLVFLLERVRLTWSSGLHGRLMRRLAADGSDRPEHYRAFRDRLVAPRHDLLRAVLHRGIGQGSIRADIDMELVIHLLVSPLIAAGLTHQPLMTPVQVELIVDTVLGGIAPS